MYYELRQLIEAYETTQSVKPVHTISELEVEEWHVNGALHREDGLAVINVAGLDRDRESEGWYINGKLHRDGGPAITYLDGSQAWYQHGIMHHDDGPAAVDSLTNAWYQNDQLHRVDGPAITYHRNDTVYYYLHDHPYSKEEHARLVQPQMVAKRFKKTNPDIDVP